MYIYLYIKNFYVNYVLCKLCIILIAKKNVYIIYNNLSLYK